MNTAAATATTLPSALYGAILAIALGAGLVVVAGHVQASALHEAAHDVRHATGFPCH